MTAKQLLAIALLMISLGTAKAHAQPEACVEEQISALDDGGDEAVIQLAKYDCKELGKLDKRVDNAKVYVDVAAAFATCTGQVEATVTLAAARLVLGITKITIHNLPCEDRPEVRVEKAKEAACSIFVTRGLPCRD
jgi:hypothetical protein